MRTGFKKLDEVIDLQGGNLILLGGTSSVGKTNFALNILSNIALKDKQSVLYFSLESSKKSIENKIISIAGMLEAPDIIRISENNAFKSIIPSKLQENMSKAKIYIDDTPRISVEEIFEKSVKIKSENDISCIIIDYLELISFDKDPNLCKHLETNEILKKLKELAQKLNVPILLTSYISYLEITHRENHIPKLDDLNPNIDYEKYADIILLLHREECFNESTKRKNIADIIIAKNTTNITTSIEITWNSKYLRFCDL